MARPKKPRNPTMEVLFQRPTPTTYTWALRHSGEPVPCVVSKSIFQSEFECFQEMARTADILHKALLSKAQSKYGDSYGRMTALSDDAEKHAVPIPESMRGAMPLPLRRQSGLLEPEKKVVKGSGRLDAKLNIPGLGKPADPNFDISLQDKVEIDEAAAHGTHVDDSYTEETDK